ncbi:patatin-like phospholipase family protein [Streptomyces sp. NPDC090306]|uniref:patatin-like phospholipase family protein n=1 Tax=Streptomyces sp. NPDC090306 TaxID=3365961 RepID=UPI0038218990
MCATRVVSSEAVPPWDPHHPVLELLRSRRAEGSTPGHRSDGARLGLAVEGGGLRGVVSAAMLTELENLGLKDAFDVVYGCSSGAVNAAYFLAGETWYPLSIYFHDLTDPRFLDFRRALLGRDVLNIDYVVDEVLEHIKPLHYERVIASAVPLVVMVTDVARMRTVEAGRFRDRDDLKSALRASCWLPLALSGTCDFRGLRAVDGGVLTAHPFLLARRTCSHVLSLSTRPMRPASRRTSFLSRVVHNRLNRLRPGLGEGYLDAVDVYRTERVRLAQQRLRSETPPHVLDLAPPLGSPEVRRHERDVGRLVLDGAVIGHEVMHWAVEGVRARAIPRIVFPPRPAAGTPGEGL